MTDLKSWALNGSTRVATPEELDGGFECGPADRDLFNWVIQQLALRSSLVTLVGFFQSVEAFQNDPPGTPEEGQSWIVDSAPTGDWIGHADEIAIWDGLAWAFVVPRPQMIVGMKSGLDFRWRADLSTPGWMRENTSIL
jgi:hypothetical protein